MIIIIIIIITEYLSLRQIIISVEIREVRYSCI